jgi:hypothetical protein
MQAFKKGDLVACKAGMGGRRVFAPADRRTELGVVIKVLLEVGHSQSPGVLVMCSGEERLYRPRDLGLVQRHEKESL